MDKRNKFQSMSVLLIAGFAALFLIACGSNTPGDQSNSDPKPETTKEDSQQNTGSDAGNGQSQDTGDVATTGNSSETGGDDVGADGGGGVGAGTITGTAMASQGVDISGTLVIACYLQDGDCDEQKSRMIEITQTGDRASYSFEGLVAGKYIMIALRDLNEDGEFDENDAIGFYEPVDRQANTVSPPAQEINIRMLVMINLSGSDGSGMGYSGLPPRTENIPDYLVGEWSNISGSLVDFYDTVTGSTAPPSGSGHVYKITHDGYYEHAGYMSSSLYSSNITAYTYETGTVEVDGENLKFHRVRGIMKLRKSSGDNYDKELDPESRIEEWNFVFDSTGSTTRFYDSDGNSYFDRKNNYCEVNLVLTEEWIFTCYNK